MLEKTSSNWAFQIMAFIHDNPLRRKFSNPEKTLIDAGLAKGQNVLEIGCGPGFFTIPASNLVTKTGKVTTIDIHPLAISKVQEKLQKSNISNVEVYLANAKDIPVPEDSIDLVFFFGLPRMLRDRSLMEQVLNEIARVCRADGKIAIKSFNKSPKALLQIHGFSFLELINGIQIYKKE